MKYLPILLSIVGVLIAMPLAAADKKIVGWIEKVRLHPGKVAVEAKLDTGAQYCSLDASNLTYFTRNGVRWVRFDLENEHGRKTTLERPIVREARIKRHFLRVQKRPVVRLGVCLGQLYREAEVNLVDRTGFQYRMLIGRNFMAGILLVDPGLTHTVEPDCGEQAKLE